jgi:hypothetical protein
MKKTIPVVLVFSLLLLTACASINMRQKLYRDGTSDLSLSVKSDSEFALNMLKNAFAENPTFEGATYKETENGFSYTLNKQRFKEDNNSNESSYISNLGISKKFKFPYYYYTITLKNQGLDLSDSESEYGQIGAMGFAFDYTIEPFGKITETNGVLLDGENAVKFDLTKTKEYSVTFKDFFLSNWFGGTKIPEMEPKELRIADDGALDQEQDTQQTNDNEEQLDDTIVQDQEDIEPEQGLTSAVYTEDDLARAILKGKAITSAEKRDEFLDAYTEKTNIGNYRIGTPYANTVLVVGDATINYDEIDQEKMKRVLYANQAIAVVSLMTAKSYYSWDAENIRLLIKDGEQIYRAEDLSVSTEMKEREDYEYDYITTVSGFIPGYEDYAKKKVQLILVLEGKEKKYDVDMSKYK